VALTPADTVVRAGAPIGIDVLAENTGQAYWLDAAPRGKGRVALAIPWFRPGKGPACSEPFGEPQSRDMILLPSVVEPGDSVRLTGTVRTPATAGRYVMLVDLVSEDTWFRHRGSTPRCYEFDVR
jgi:hypothetical protein